MLHYCSRYEKENPTPARKEGKTKREITISITEFGRSILALRFPFFSRDTRVPMGGGGGEGGARTEKEHNKPRRATSVVRVKMSNFSRKLCMLCAESPLLLLHI